MTIASVMSLSDRRKKFNFIADVVAVCSPTVVYIEINNNEKLNLNPGKPTYLSNGSGFIVREDGLILTNAHMVINKPNAIVSVRLLDGSTHIAQVENVDPKYDLATLRIPVKNLPTMKFGSTAVIPGEWVVAMGSNTVTAGVVSSAQKACRDIGFEGPDMVFIETNACITYGNSGGPLVNLDGEAIGINRLNFTTGISYAIPIGYVWEFLAKCEINVPPLYRRCLGIRTFTLTPNILKELKMKNPEVQYNIQNGIFIYEVIIGSTAHKCGLQTGDIITELNGTPVTLSTDVDDVLENVPKELTVQILRGRTRTTVTLIPELREKSRTKTRTAVPFTPERH